MHTAQPFLAHRHAADDNFLNGCTRPRPDRWLVAAQCPFRWQPMPISLLVWVRFLLNQMFWKHVPFDNTDPIYLISLLWKLGLRFRLESRVALF